MQFEKIASKMRKEYAAMLRQHNIYVGQEVVFCKLAEKDGLTHNELREILNCEAPTVTNMVKALEKNGFVERKVDTNDSRVRRVFLTEAGYAKTAPIQQIWQVQQQKMFQNFTDEECQMLRLLLNKLNQNLQ